MNPIQIAVVDDHNLFRKGIINLIHSLGTEFEVVQEASNGTDFLSKLSSASLPDIAIIDLNMPHLNGYETTEKLNSLYPEIKVLILTMETDEFSVLKMLRLGIKGYLGKDVEPEELKQALEHIYEKGFHYNEFVTHKLIAAIQSPSSVRAIISNLNDRELTFLKLATSELTYKEIADQMCLSIKTIDGYRANLFENLDVKSRVGLALFAVKYEIVKL